MRNFLPILCCDMNFQLNYVYLGTMDHIPRPLFLPNSEMHLENKRENHLLTLPQLPLPGAEEDAKEQPPRNPATLSGAPTSTFWCQLYMQMKGRTETIIWIIFSKNRDHYFKINLTVQLTFRKFIFIILSMWPLSNIAPCSALALFLEWNPSCVRRQRTRAQQQKSPTTWSHVLNNTVQTKGL